MKVLHVINSLNIGGAERLIIEILPLLSEKTYCLDLVLLSDVSTDFLKEIEKYKNIKIYKLGKNIYNPLYIFKIRNIIKNYDVIHVHLFPSLYFVAIAKFLLGKNNVRLVFTEHSTSNRRLSSFFFNHLDRIIYKCYNKIICITPQVKEVLNKKLLIPNEKIEVIYNGINIEKIKLSVVGDRRVFGISDDTKVLIMVAGFRHEKDHVTVLEVLKLLPENYLLLLVGDGEKRAEIENKIKSLGIDLRVILLGFRNDVFSLIKMSDVAILSSHWEGFGLSAAEAMACGTPVLASNVNGLAQVVSGGGELFEKGNILELYNKIIALEKLENYSSLKIKGINKANDFSIYKTVNEIYELYKNILI